MLDWQLQDAKNRFSEVVKRARDDGPQTVTVHGWVYSLDDGLVRDMGISIANIDELEQRYQTVLAKRYSEAS